jgi:hypothetical protein
MDSMMMGMDLRTGLTQAAQIRFKRIHLAMKQYRVAQMVWIMTAMDSSILVARMETLDVPMQVIIQNIRKKLGEVLLV